MAAELTRKDLMNLTQAKLRRKYGVKYIQRETKKDLVNRILYKNKNKKKKKRNSSKHIQNKKYNNNNRRKRNSQQTSPMPSLILSNTDLSLDIVHETKNDPYRTTKNKKHKQSKSKPKQKRITKNNNANNRLKKMKDKKKHKNKLKKLRNKKQLKKQNKQSNQQQQRNNQSPLPSIPQDQETSNNQSFPELVNTLSGNTSRKHQRSSSMIEIILQAPKQQYTICGMRLFDTVRDVKIALPIHVECRQCKLFYKGKELNDNHTLSEINVDTIGVCRFKILISWNYFKPDPKLPHPKTVEHQHYDKVKELKKINKFELFSKLVTGLSRECGVDIQQLGIDEQKILNEYCLCLSGNKTYERRWTNLHSICYDYENNIGDIVKLLREEDLYIDAWPHSGYETPLRIAINRAIPKMDQDEKINEININGAVELIEFLVLHGSRRMIRPTVVNLERKAIHDHLYKGMHRNIRRKIVDILRPHIDEDPYKPKQMEHGDIITLDGCKATVH
eukprot:231151_1